MKNENEYNGWTNYATWRIMLELFDGHETDSEVDADYAHELAEDYIFETSCVDTSLMEDYARAFMADINWYEIADAINVNNDITVEP